jgi:sugar phosphate permease
MNRAITQERPAPELAIPTPNQPLLWAILALMVLSVAINYIDRGSLSTAAPLLKTDLSIGPKQLGLLLSAFFWTYALLQVVSGWLVDRYEVKWVMAIGFCVWSAAMAVTGLAQSFEALVLLRLLLGVGESVAYPCYCKILAAYFSEQHRGLANGLIDAGTKMGPALGMLAGGMLMARYGWRPFFIVLGLGSLLWLPAWFKWMPPGHAGPDATTPKGLDFAQILVRGSAWATFVGHFCGNYFWYFLLTWLPYYLVQERGFSMDKMAVISAVAYGVTATATTIAGCVADRFIASGANPLRIRLSCTTLGLATATLVVGVGFVHSSTTALVLLMISCFCYGVFASSHWALTQTIAGPASVGRWSGIQNCFANMAGVAAPAVTGLLVQNTGHFLWAFVVSAAVVLTGASVYGFMLARWNLCRP